MKLVCPGCGCFGSAEVFLAEGAELDVVKTALSVPSPLAGPLVAYLRLFAPPTRAITSRRLRTLLAELLPLIAAGKIDRRGRIWPAPVETWQAALEEVIARRDRLTLPLKSHGYLLEIVVGIADKAEGGAEAKRELNRAYAYSGERRTDGARPVRTVIQEAPKGSPMPQAVREQLGAFGIKPTKEPS